MKQIEESAQYFLMHMSDAEFQEAAQEATADGDQSMMWVHDWAQYANRASATTEPATSTDAAVTAIDAMELMGEMSDRQEEVDIVCRLLRGVPGAELGVLPVAVPSGAA